MRLFDIECIFRTTIEEMEVPDEWLDDNGDLKLEDKSQFETKAKEEALECLTYCYDFEVEGFMRDMD